MKDEIEKLDNHIENLQKEIVGILRELGQKTNDAKLYREQEKFHIKDMDRLSNEIEELEIKKR